jgi:hypothetical protein
MLSGLLAGCGKSSDETAADTGEPPEYTLSTRDPFEPPTDRLEGSGVEGCALYREERCEGGQRQVCAVYDPSAGAFVETPDADLERVLDYERWYELYHSPDGQTAERDFVAETPAGTPEEEWGSLEHFSNYNGFGDSAIWTGVALNAFLLRYLETGTEADYQRMEDKVRALLLNFEVTGVDGYLARAHALQVESGAEKTDAHLVEYASDDFRVRPIEDPGSIEGLPEDYLAAGAAPIWRGNPSIDQYTGPMVALPAAWGLLRDEGLKDDVTRHLTCYLKRLRRVEIINLQENPDAVAAVEALLGGGAVSLDEDDINFAELDTIVAYYLQQLNDESAAEDFEFGCPDTIATEPELVIDASDDDFAVELVSFALNLASADLELAGGIDHLYAPSVRGGDAVHLMHLAAMGWHFTGEQQYKDFLERELVGQIRTVEVAGTAGALVLPSWCRSFYGDHITIAPTWALTNLLEDSPLRDAIVGVLAGEMWDKLASNLGNAKFELMIGAAAGDDTIAAAGAARVLDFGGNGGVFHDPRRSYTVTWDEAVEAVGEDPVCPTEEERGRCEDGFEVLGVTIPGESITGECTGAQGECELSTGCVEAESPSAIPVPQRPYTDFLWQRNPFELGKEYGAQGQSQSPGLDLIESYWLARHYDLIGAGEGQVLAWEDMGACE